MNFSQPKEYFIFAGCTEHPDRYFSVCATHRAPNMHWCESKNCSAGEVVILRGHDVSMQMEVVQQNRNSISSLRAHMEQAPGSAELFRC